MIAVRGILALTVTAGVLVGGCGSENRALDEEQLEQEIAGLYPPKDDTTRVRVRCDDGLGATLGATSDCRVRVGRDRAVVRATVTAADDDGVRFDAVPYVPADRLAREILGVLVEQEQAVGQVLCAGDLLGRPGESVTCAAEPPDGGRRTVIEAGVTSVDGLDVQITYRGLD